MDAAITRFSRRFRLLHWAHAIPFLFLLISGLSLFIPPLKALHVGGFRLVPLLHVIVGIAFILSPLPLFVAVRSDAVATADLRSLYRLRPEDRAWARYALGAVLGARVRLPLMGKFNLGQKANALFTVVVTVGLMASGAVLAVNFFSKRVLSAAFVEHVFPVHDLLMLLALPVLVAHVYLGSLNPSTRESLRGMTHGWVRRTWAREHHALWVKELEASEGDTVAGRSLDSFH